MLSKVNKLKKLEVLRLTCDFRCFSIAPALTLITENTFFVRKNTDNAEKNELNLFLETEWKRRKRRIGNNYILAVLQLI